MSRTVRFTFVIALLSAASACGSRVQEVVLPAEDARPTTNTGPAPTDSTSVARGPGTFGSGS